MARHSLGAIVVVCFLVAIAIFFPGHQSFAASGRTASNGRGSLRSVGTTQSLTQDEQQQLRQLLARHRAADAEAWPCLLVTGALWLCAVCLLHVTGGHWAAVICLSLTLARTFMIYHDACHGSFFEGAEGNRNLSQVLQFFVNYNANAWDNDHNKVHHGNLGDASSEDPSLTIAYAEAELEGVEWWIHRIIRDPLIFYPLWGFLAFFVHQFSGQTPYRLVLPLLIWLSLGSQTTLAYVLAIWVAGIIGVMTFHLQHQCNTPYRMPDTASRSPVDAALMGSTRIPVPAPVAFFSLGVEYHHIHHLDVKVPGYRLAQCDAEGSNLGLWRNVNTLDVGRAFKSLFHTQFEGSRKCLENDQPPRFISFWPYSALGLQDV